MTSSGDELVVDPSSGANFLELSVDDYGQHPTGDLYEVVRKGRGLTVNSSPMSSHRHEALLPTTPSDGEMAAWLYPIISHGDQKHVSNDGVVEQNGRPKAPLKETMNKQLEENKLLTTKKSKLAKDTTNQNGASARRKTGGGGRRANYTGAHRQTEKRRRFKINEKLKTLQQLVPGCEPSQASTLDQTIHYVRSLQHQVQAISVVGCSMPPVPAAASNRAALLGPPPMMVAPFVPMLPCPAHHPAVIRDAAVDLPASSCACCWWPSSSSGLQ